jgi:hypothetical protein
MASIPQQFVTKLLGVSLTKYFNDLLQGKSFGLDQEEIDDDDFEKIPAHENQVHWKSVSGQSQGR